MDRDLVVIASLVALFLLWVLLPLVPSILIYRLFPDTPVGIRGPLGQLTLRAGGAFAAYVTTILICLPFTNGLREDIGSLAKPVWTVSADLVFVDSKGQEVTAIEDINNLSVDFNPRIHTIGSKNLRLRVPGTGSDWPHILLQLPKFGGTFIDLNNSDMRVDYYEKVLHLEDPVIIKQVSRSGSGLGQQP